MKLSLVICVLLFISTIAEAQLLKSLSQSESSLVGSSHKSKLDKLASAPTTESVSIASVGVITETLAGTELQLGLPSVFGKSIRGTIRQFKQKTKNHFSLLAEGDNDIDYIILGKKDGQYYGQVRSGYDVYDIEHLVDNKVVIIKYDRSKLKEVSCGSPGKSGAKTPATNESPKEKSGSIVKNSSRSSNGGPPVMNLVNPTVRVLFLYTPAAALQGHNMPSVANTIMSQYSAARGYSEITTELELAGVVSFNFTEFYDEQMSYAAIVRHNAYLISQHSTAQSLRDSYEADIVVTLTDGDFSNVAGSVINEGTDEAEAYAVVELDKATVTYSAIHEIGHLFDCQHQGAHPSGYNNGFSWSTGLPPFNTVFGTIMREWLGNNNFVRVLHYSNPDVSRNGEATGNDNADNARVIDENGPTVMNHRYTYVPFTAAISGSDYGAAGEPMYFYVDIIYPGVEPYSYYWTSSAGSPSTDAYYQFNMGTSTVSLNLSVTDASNNGAGDYKYVNWNGLYYLKEGPGTKASADEGFGSIFPNPTADYFEFNFNPDKNGPPVKVEMLAVTGAAQKIAPPTNNNNGRYKVNISHLTAGEYFVVLTHGDQKLIQRIIKSQ